MTAVASVPALIPSSAIASDQPVVFVDGLPQLGVSGVAYQSVGPLDQREVSCLLPRNFSQAKRDWLAAHDAYVAQPHALSDGQTHWEVLAAGRLQQAQRSLDDQIDGRRITLVDDWAAALSRPFQSVWALLQGEPMPLPRAVFGVGLTQNRSANRHLGNGKQVYLPLATGRGESWTLAQALETLSAFAAIELSDAHLPRDISDRALLESVDLTKSIGEALESIVQPVGLVIRRELSRMGTGVVGVQAVVPGDWGRRIFLPWPDETGRGGRVLQTDIEQPLAPPRRWIASGSRAVVESTFELIHGWDADLEGQADSEYGRATSSDFEKFSSVYRRWALNEDGRYTASPFSAGPAFDLSKLFDDEAIVSTPLRFGACLTRDSSGQRISPVVEVSTDSGASWSRYAGDVNRRSDHAALLFDDADLPAPVLAAAQAGTLKVRLTATLTSPVAIQATRWQGNPFAGPGPDKHINWAQAYGWQRVEAQSIHANAIDLGELEADEFDDRLRLSADLAQHVVRRAATEAAGKIKLGGVWSALRIGDRVIDPAGQGTSALGLPTSVDRSGLPIRKIEVRYDTQRAASTTHIFIGAN